MSDKLKEITRETIERYSKRYHELGVHVRTLGWGSREQQVYRFEQTLRCLPDLNGKTILDIGCGFGDYSDFLHTKGVNPKKYTGWDINNDFIKEAQRRYNNSDRAEFRVVDLFSPDLKTEEERFDVAVSLGVLNFNLKDRYDNIAYSKQFIEKAFRLVRKALLVDFLSQHRDPSYPMEDFVFYHDPSEILDYALTITHDVTLHHNYLPIPQKEFMLVLYK